MPEPLQTHTAFAKSITILIMDLAKADSLSNHIPNIQPKILYIFSPPSHCVQLKVPKERFHFRRLHLERYVNAQVYTI